MFTNNIWLVYLFTCFFFQFSLFQLGLKAEINKLVRALDAYDIPLENLENHKDSLKFDGILLRFSHHGFIALRHDILVAALTFIIDPLEIFEIIELFRGY